MNSIAAGSHVTLHYRLSAVIDGQLYEVINTFDGQPATLQIGAGQLVEQLEQCLLGLQEGAQVEHELTPQRAFGDRNEALVQTLSRVTFDANSDEQTAYVPGDMVEFNAPNGGRFVGVLKSRDDEKVVVDFNHPLAGRTVHFAARVIGVL
jgi:FKBP-type peptidyl-prolyl cis-trans isomerase SlpA